jgi:sodium/hydrogen antiporter
VFLEQASGLVSLLVWLSFGALTISTIADRANLVLLLYAILSLTLVRMVPVAVALIGAGVDRAVRGLVRSTGLASLVFALLALEELGADADEAIAVIGLTVLLSVLAHGLSLSFNLPSPGVSCLCRSFGVSTRRSTATA